MMNEKVTRRRFLGTVTPAAIGAGLIGVRAARAADAPKSGVNGKVRLGMIGCGGRGMQLQNIIRTHLAKEAELAAICDVHRGRMAILHKVCEGKPRTYHDYRKMLEDPSIDAVIVCTNGHWHVLPAIDACRAGKDVYIEKPVGTRINEGRAAINAAKKYGRIIQVGTQQRMWPMYQEAVEIIRSGRLGDISYVHVWDVENYYPGAGCPPDSDPPAELDWDFWLGPSPAVKFNKNRLANHYWFFDYGGGWQVDWAVHHYDIVHWAMGVTAPIAASASGRKFVLNDNWDWPDTFDGCCEYGPGPVAKKGFLMAYTCRCANMRLIENRQHGKAFFGSNGTMVLSREGYEIYSETRQGKKVVEEQALADGGDGCPNQLKATADRFRDLFQRMEKRDGIGTIEHGHYSSNPGHLMNIAWRSGRAIRWDAEKEQVIEDPQANEWVSKQYREPWSLEG